MGSSCNIVSGVGSVLSSMNYLKCNLYTEISAVHLDSESCSLLGMWLLKPHCSLTLQDNSFSMIRKLVICFFIENHSAPPDVTTYTSEHSIQVERPQGSTTSRTAPKYGNAELMETGDGRSSDSYFFSFINPRFYDIVLLYTGLGVFLVHIQWTPGPGLSPFLRGSCGRWHRDRKCQWPPSCPGVFPHRKSISVVGTQS